MSLAAPDLGGSLELSESEPESGTFQYGGQAVIEGVMMRGPRSLAVALRSPSGEVITHREDFVSWGRRWAILGKPFIRGPVALAETLYIGIKALLFSANEVLEEEGSGEMTSGDVFWTMLVATLFVVGIFILLPTVLVNFLWGLAGKGSASGPGLERSPILFNLAEGIIRMIFIVIYMWVISRMKDIQRVLEYHGAEHKVINAFESGEGLAGLNVDDAREDSRFHPRCGTSFLLFVGLVSIILFSLFGWPGLWRRLLYRLVLLPVVASLSYEMIKLAGSNLKSPVMRLMTLPGMWLQNLTTREPDDKQLEVAIRALAGVLEG
jgi:uncharacterized protein YqhQ